MTDFTEISVDIADSVATLTLDRPDALNAISPRMLAELNEAVDAVRSDESVRILVLTGRGRAFSAGVDLKAIGDREITDGAVGDILDVPARRLTAALSDLRIPVVAAVNGFCFTGALEIALACDLILVAEEARLGDTHAKFGLRPTWGMTQRLPDAVGVTRARELSYTARMFDGREAVAMGLAARSAPATEFDDALRGLLDEILANGTDSHAAYKELYRERLPLEAGLSREYKAEFAFDDADTAARLADFR